MNRGGGIDNLRGSDENRCGRVRRRGKPRAVEDSDFDFDVEEVESEESMVMEVGESRNS
jgi:hypothetical protein